MLAPPNAAHWLGTNAFGRDVLSRVIYGARTALVVGFGAAFVGATAGAVLGVGSAYFRGWIDLVLQRVMDAFNSFRLIILALAMVRWLDTRVTS
jgi:peptide/nickel transport system permease protein